MELNLKPKRKTQTTNKLSKQTMMTNSDQESQKTSNDYKHPRTRIMRNE